MARGKKQIIISDWDNIKTWELGSKCLNPSSPYRSRVLVDPLAFSLKKNMCDEKDCAEDAGSRVKKSHYNSILINFFVKVIFNLLPWKKTFIHTPCSCQVFHTQQPFSAGCQRYGQWLPLEHLADRKSWLFPPLCLNWHLKIIIFQI